MVLQFRALRKKFIFPQKSLSIFLITILVKDRPQEVKETLLLPRKCLFASERHLHPQAMQK
jgi:hypothetical protein